MTRSTLDNVIAASGESILSAAQRCAAFTAYERLAPPEIKPGAFWKRDLAQLDFSHHAPYRRTGDDGLALSSAWTIVPAPERSGLLVQVDSEVVHAEADAVLAGRGVRVLSLEQAKRELPAVFATSFHAVVKKDESKFAALTAAFQTGGAFIYVPTGVRVEHPIVITYVAREAALFPHTVVVAEAGAEVTVIEHLISHETKTPAVIAVSEVIAREGARVAYSIVQDVSSTGIRIATARSAPEKDAEVSFSTAELGGELVLTRLEGDLRQSGARAIARGLFFANDAQHLDLNADVHHAVGQTASTTVFKGAARNAGQARFHGNIRIAPAAHGAEASLREDALILSKDAHIDSVPGLEIAANDVKAYHGTTVGAIDEEEIFYVMTRGIARGDAEKLIAVGFFEPLIEHFPTSALRAHLRSAIETRIA